MAVDQRGNIYLAGWIDLDTIPIVNGFQSTPVDLRFGSGFVVQLDPRAEKILYSTYIGSMGFSRANSVAVDTAGYAVTPNAFQKHLGLTLWSSAHCYGGFEVAFCSDAFLTGLSADGRALIYSTYLGGDGPDLVQAMALDPTNGRVYLTGQACGFFPVTEDAPQGVSANCTRNARQ
jgi:hypothetical protein